MSSHPARKILDEMGNQLLTAVKRHQYCISKIIPLIIANTLKEEKKLLENDSDEKEI